MLYAVCGCCLMGVYGLFVVSRVLLSGVCDFVMVCLVFCVACMRVVLF